ncbi:uncharacterized protein LOC125869645 [Solanum stenotomum]|uniref:uncharacterized protein LOC125869645 n=1 Tax=Solanum stenotomum TaxID=172797 RepID=UPI0020D0510F|nr:uncharacterized protein LOC125869645 [Solanum stenotomum]
MAIDNEATTTLTVIDHHHPLYLQACDTPVPSWIMNVVSKELLSGIMYASSAHKVWTDLKERLDKVDGSRVFHLHTEINHLTQGTSSISSYFSKMKELWEEFDAFMPCPSCECAESKKYVEHFEYQHL